ncbi:MAG: hypothetical protein CMH41_08685 [Micrococcales bacterium]|nr:hypothetical protein [Micrococcales bacterium]
MSADMGDLELAVVGAGPQALTLLTYLAEHGPRELLERTRVFDTSDWLTTWHHQFASYEIPMLRSAWVHHPHPDPYGLIRFGRQEGRDDEFFGRIGRPSTRLFADYCDKLLDGYGLRELRTSAQVTDLRPLPAGGVELTTTTGTWRARRAVLATNPIRPLVPSWLGGAWAKHGREPGAMHSKDWSADTKGQGPVVVVGGGLTAAQIVSAHALAGDPVTWLTRTLVRERDLDIEAVWLGPNLGKFHSVVDLKARVTMARKARGGGSIPNHEGSQLEDLIQTGRVAHLRGAVDGLQRTGEGWKLNVRHQGRTKPLPAANVVCATGSRAHVRYETLLRRCRTERPVRRVAGLPMLNRDLSWPDTSVHLMGPLALAQVGPSCRTVIGARIAAERVVESWGGAVNRQYPGPK